jgi:hypothetical protein
MKLSMIRNQISRRKATSPKSAFLDCSLEGSVRSQHRIMARLLGLPTLTSSIDTGDLHTVAHVGVIEQGTVDSRTIRPASSTRLQVGQSIDAAGQ